jgi:hypothetical protein
VPSLSWAVCVNLLASSIMVAIFLFGVPIKKVNSVIFKSVRIMILLF